MTAPATFEYRQRFGRGFHLPTRMTALPLAEGKLALVSPIPLDPAAAARVDALGEVRYLVAPNLFHHLYLGEAKARYPHAEILAPADLRAKEPDLPVGATLDAPPAPFAAHVDVLAIEGAPVAGEHALFHRASGTLILTDLVFHVLEPEGLLTHALLALTGARRRLAASRLWRFFVDDGAAFRESLARVLALPFTQVIVGHGECLVDDARPRLEQALRRRFGSL